MVWSWQLWLSPRPLRRTDTSGELSILAANDSALFEFKKEKGRWVVIETHFIANPIVRKGLSGPQLHIHLRQTEFFEVQQGVLGILKNEKEHVVTRDSGVVVVPPGTRHRFWVHSSAQEDVVFKVWAEPQDLDHSFDENFLRNFIILFGYNSATVPSPPFWLPIWLLTALNYFLASWIAEGLLGYKPSYPEYNRAVESNGTSDKKST